MIAAVWGTTYKNKRWNAVICYEGVDILLLSGLPCVRVCVSVSVIELVWGVCFVKTEKESHLAVCSHSYRWISSSAADTYRHTWATWVCVVLFMLQDHCSFAGLKSSCKINENWDFQARKKKILEGKMFWKYNNFIPFCCYEYKCRTAAKKTKPPSAVRSNANVF